MDLGTCLNKKMVASTTKTKGATNFTERIFGICLHRLGNGFGNMLQQDKRRLPAKIWGLRQLTQKWAIDLRQVALQTSLDNDNMADRLFSKHLHDLSHGMGLGTCLNEKKWQHHQLKATKRAIYFTDMIYSGNLSAYTWEWVRQEKTAAVCIRFGCCVKPSILNKLLCRCI
jgi:hypothetical protein